MELILCSLVTILPDYLFRRYVQGKRIGKEITLYSVWFELRWGIITCLLLTVGLITLIFYYHPSTNTAVSFFRTVAILPEGSGRVAEVYVEIGDEVKAGDPIFRVDDSEKKAAVETAERKIAEIDASMKMAEADLAEVAGRISEAESSLKQAQDELDTKAELQARNPGTVAARDIEKLQNVVDSREGALAAAQASRQSVETQISTLLPAQKASAEAALNEAKVDLAKTVVYAGVDGTVEQFVLRVGDMVNPIMRSAGILVPAEAGRETILAGFGQIEAQVMKKGMVAEATCLSKPFTIIPMVVAEVQGVVAAGQVRQTDTLIDAQQVTEPGTISVFLEPLYDGGLSGVPPGSNCYVNAYTNNHELIQSGDLSTPRLIFLHVVDTVGVVHAVILRMHALILPVQTLVFKGH